MSSPADDPGAAARLRARPGPIRTPAGAERGVLPLGLDPARDSYLYAPTRSDPARPLPLLLMLHGAGGHAHHGLHPLMALAESREFLVLAPASRAATWDVLRGGFGPDVAMLDRALDRVFAHYAIDPARVALGGFSDGASYALSLGISNGDLFSHLIAFSPGFVAPAAQEGAPRIYVSHGTRDAVLPIDVCSRRLVPRLQRAGYDVRYHEFDGPHTIPPAVAEEAVGWFLEE